MSKLHQWISNRMEELRLQLKSDFIGLAVYDIMTDEIRWRIAVGASNTRYKRIVIRMGKGIAGEVIQLNRTIKVDQFPADVQGDPIEYPILLIEHIKSAIAVPISCQNRVSGVLLVGNRQTHYFNNDEENKIKITAKQIAEKIEEVSKERRFESEETNQLDKSINNVVFVKFLKEIKTELLQKKRGELNYELLDQSFVEIPDEIQQVMIKNMEEFINIIHNNEMDNTTISIMRDEGLILIDCISTNVNSPLKPYFEKIYQRMGEIGGSIVSYREKDTLHFTMQIPVWIYRNPLFG